MNRETSEYLIKKLYKIFKDGYRPARGGEPYDFFYKETAIGLYTNCLGHAMFNLTNAQFADYDIRPPRYITENYYCGFIDSIDDLDYDYNADKYLLDVEKIFGEIETFVRETGLKIEECSETFAPEDFNSWKVACYLSEGLADYHFMLQEQNGVWSSKNGFFRNSIKTFKSANKKLLSSIISVALS